MSFIEDDELDHYRVIMRQTRPTDIITLIKVVSIIS